MLLGLLFLVLFWRLVLLLLVVVVVVVLLLLQGRGVDADRPEVPVEV